MTATQPRRGRPPKPAPASALHELRLLADQLAAHQQHAAQLTRRRDELIRALVAAGAGHRAIAHAARIVNQRVSQIARER